MVFRYGWYKIKSPIHKTFHQLLYEIFRRPPFVMRYYGYDLVYGREDGQVSHIASGFPYEKDLINAALRYMKSQAVVFDIGANIGLITLALASIKPDSLFHCFEPSPYPCRMFRESIKRNLLGSRIFLNNLGVYKKPGRLMFYTHGIKDSSGDGIRDTGRAGVAIPIEINVISIDKYVEGKNIKRLDLMKIDVEGGELFVLQGAYKTIQNYTPVIFFEATDKNLAAYNLKLKDLFHFFRRRKYGVHNLRGKLLNESLFLRATEKEYNFIAIPYS